MTYTSVLAGTPSDLEVTWTNSQEAALTPDGDGIYTIEGFAEGPVMGLRNGTIEAVTYNRLTVDNASDWTLWSSTNPARPFPYVEYLKYDIASAQKIWYQLNTPPTYRFEDRSGNANHSTSLSYPLGDNIEVTLDSVESSGASPVPEASSDSGISLLGDVTNMGLNADGDSLFVYGEPVSGPGWTNLFDRASESMGLEMNTLLGIAVLFISVILGLGAYIVTGSPIMTIVGAGIAIFAGVTLGALSPWFIVIFVMVGGATIRISRSI